MGIRTSTFAPLLCVLLVAAAALWAHSQMGPSASDLKACQGNLKNLGVALEMWSTDHNGHYPKSLGELTPNYLLRIPACPAARFDTYSATYWSEWGCPSEAAYLLWCDGGDHGEGVVPAYHSIQGLTTTPEDLEQAKRWTPGFER